VLGVVTVVAPAAPALRPDDPERDPPGPEGWRFFRPPGVAVVGVPLVIFGEPMVVEEATFVVMLVVEVLLAVELLVLVVDPGAVVVVVDPGRVVVVTPATVVGVVLLVVVGALVVGGAVVAVVVGTVVVVGRTVVVVGGTVVVVVGGTVVVVVGGTVVVVVGATVVEVVLGGRKMVVVDVGGGKGRRVGAADGAAPGRSMITMTAPTGTTARVNVLQKLLRGGVVVMRVLRATCVHRTRRRGSAAKMAPE
jgi:hypothetical protein